HKQPGETTAEQAAVMTRTLNDWLKRPDLLHGTDLTPLARKLNRQGAELLAKSPAERSEAETVRLHRYIFEVLYPDAIRKLEGESWQPVLLIYGTIGVCLAVIFWGFYRNTPREHFLANQAEAELVEAHKTPEDTAPPMPMSTVVHGILT